jgi:hypothetical protein
MQCSLARTLLASMTVKGPLPWRTAVFFAWRLRQPYMQNAGNHRLRDRPADPFFDIVETIERGACRLRSAVTLSQSNGFWKKRRRNSSLAKPVALHCDSRS